MNIGTSIFAQLVTYIPRAKFKRIVRKYRGESGVRTFSCWDQLLCMFFAQLTYRDSLRDTVTCLRALGPKLFHMGIRGKVSRSTLAEANEQRDWRIFQELALHLIKSARRLYKDDEFAIEFKGAVYAFDSTTIDLCLSLFPWARFMDGAGGKLKGAVKLHTLLDLRGNIPTFVHISDGKLHDVISLDFLIIEPLAFYVFDRGYHDFERLYRFERSRAFFVTRPRSNTLYRRLYSHKIDKSTGIRCDQIIALTGKDTQRYYPEKLRLIRYQDAETGAKLSFITNNFDLPALSISQLYKERWQVELFFKWIKQHLRIKSFFGTSENAVRAQIWMAIASYVLIAIVKKRLALEQSLYTVLQILSVCALEKSPILSMFQNIIDIKNEPPLANQLSLF